MVKKPTTFVLQTLNQCLEVTWETFLPALKSTSEHLMLSYCVFIQRALFWRDHMYSQGLIRQSSKNVIQISKQLAMFLSHKIQTCILALLTVRKTNRTTSNLCCLTAFLQFPSDKLQCIREFYYFKATQGRLSMHVQRFANRQKQPKGNQSLGYAHLR